MGSPARCFAESLRGITYGGAEGGGEPSSGTLHAKINGHIDLSEQASSALGGFADATWGAAICTAW